MLRTVTGAAAALCLLLAFDAVADGRPGVPLAATQSVAQTTADIMARQAATPPVTVPRFAPRLVPNLPRQQSPNALPAPALKVAAPGAGPQVAQTFSTNFLGGRLFDAQAFPPDSMGAVGPSQFIVAINGRIRSFDKFSGTTDGVLDVTTDVFFAPVMTKLGGSVTANFTSDIRIRFDRFTKRWYMVMIDVPNNGSGTFFSNLVMVAASDTAQISTATTWQMISFKPGTDFVDYPTLGIDNNALYIGANIFNTAGTALLRSEGYVVQKTAVLASAVISQFQLWNGACGDGLFTPQGVDNFNSATEGYFVGVSACFFGELLVDRIVNPGSGAPSLTTLPAVAVAQTNLPPTTPHLGNTGGNNGRTDALDDRLMSAQIRGGVLYTAHTQPVNSAGVTPAVTPPSTGDGIVRNGARWYRLGSLTTSPALLESGTAFDSTATNSETTDVKWYSMPGINVNGQGNVAIGFTAAGPLQHLNAAFTGRLAGDPAGQTDAPALYTNTLAAYNPPGDPGGGGGRRWGDYSYTSVDPDDDQTMWTVQEYADQPNSWAVRVAKLMAPPPATPSAVTVPSIPAGTASTTFSITGTSSGGPAFFDPGSGFANHIKVEIVPGVTVTSVTVTDATHLSVTVSTVGASVGPKVIRVTNPDGQVALDGGTLFTVTGTAAPTITSPNSLICTVGSPCNFTFTAAAGPVAPTFAVAGTLPAGVAFANPSLSGTPGAGTQGTYTLTVTASNGTLPNAVQTFTLYVVAGCGGFTDVAATDGYCNAVDWLINRGVTVGCLAGPHTYCPSDPVTRAQMALFMQRLGDVISPLSYSDNVQATGPLAVDSRPAFCTTPDFPVVLPSNTNFPRVALVTWSFEGNASDPLTARVFSQTSFDSGGTFATNEVNLKRVQAQAQGWVGTTATVKVQVPAGAAPRFRLRVDREAGTVTTGNFIVGRCNIAVMFMSVNGGALPYDAVPAGPGEQ